MNKLYRLPLRMRSKTQLADPRHRRKSTNPVVAGILAVGALFALAAIGLMVFGAFRHKPDMPKEVGITSAPAVADVSPAESKGTESKGTESKGKVNDAVVPLANPNPTLSSRSINDEQPSAPVASATPSRSSSPGTTLTSTARKHEQKAETDTKNPEKPPLASAAPSRSSSPAATLTPAAHKHEQKAETDPKNPEKPPLASAAPSHSSSPAATLTPAGRRHEQKAETNTENPEKPLTKAARQNLEKKPQEGETETRNLEPFMKTARQNLEKKPQEAEAETRNPEKPLTKTARLSLEKKREEAERKRARLEEKYQHHEISADVYNKGEEEYKNEIQKYRNELKSGG